MQKRLFITVLLSFLVIVSWQLFTSKTAVRTSGPAESQEQFVSPQRPSPAVSPAVPTVAPVETDLPTSELSFEPLSVVFTDPTASINKAIFKRFKDNTFTLRNGLAMGGEKTFDRQSIDNKTVRYIASDAGQRITKDISFSGTDVEYEAKVIISIENTSDQTKKVSFPLALGTLMFQNGTVFQDVAVSTSDRIHYPSVRKNGTFSSVNFLSMRDSHFCAIIEPKEKNYKANIQKLDDKTTTLSLQSPEFELFPGQSVAQEFRLYIGPQDLRILKNANPEWQSIVYFGKMDAIAHILLNSLAYFQSLTNNWGVAIILVSIIIYVILFPLTLKQLRSMREMQVIQPKVEELRCKYRTDPNKMQRAMMDLYKEHKINPLGGCLPMLLQIPVFFSFYNVLSRSIELKGANFLWIKDLSEPDKLFYFPQAVPFLGHEFNLLPILMVIASFFQQKFSSASTQMSGSSAQQQKIMLFVFPLMFGVFFYHMPSGLVLYWFTNTILTVGQQTLIMKKK